MGPVIREQLSHQEPAICEETENKTKYVQHTPGKPSTESSLAGCLP